MQLFFMTFTMFFFPVIAVVSQIFFNDILIIWMFLVRSAIFYINLEKQTFPNLKKYIGKWDYNWKPICKKYIYKYRCGCVATRLKKWNTWWIIEAASNQFHQVRWRKSSDPCYVKVHWRTWKEYLHCIPWKGRTLSL